MKKALQFLLLAAAAMMPWSMNAQNTLTVCNGTDSNEYVPIYGYYADAPQTSQMIFPASMLTAMQGSFIEQMVFHIASDGGNNDDLGDWIVSLGITTATTLDDLDDDTPLTQVYSGRLVFDDNYNATTMTVSFNTPFTYTGGNLLVEFDHPSEAGYNHYYFYGVSATGASYSWDDVQDFLPKTTFTYATCARPANLTASNVITTSAIMSWNGNAASYEYELLSPTGGPVVSSTTSSTSVVLSGLTTHTQYLFRVRALCSASDISEWATYNLTTAFCDDACPVVIELHDSYGDGWDDAHLSIIDSLTNDTLASLTVIDSLNIVYLPLCPNRSYFVHWTSASWNSECSYYIYTLDSTIIDSASAPDDGIHASFYHTCSAAAPDSVFFYVSVNDPSMGTTRPAPGRYAFAVGDYASINAIPTEGYRFNNWTIVAMGQTFTFNQNPYADTIPALLGGMTISVVANFSSDTNEEEEFFVVNLSVNNREWGYTEPGVGRLEYSVGDSAVITAYPASDMYVFDHWNIAAADIADTDMYENPLVMGIVPEAVLGIEIDITAYFAPVGGIDGANDALPYIVLANDGNIIIRGASQQSVRIYDLMGRMVFFTDNASDEQVFRPANMGVYLVKVGDISARRVVVK